MIPVFDGHNDALMETYLPEGDGRSLADRLSKGHFDLPRAREGGFSGGMFAIFVPPSHATKTAHGTFRKMEEILAAPVEPAHAARMAERGIDALAALERASGGTLALARSVEEIRGHMASGVISAVLHFEGAEPIAPDLSNLDDFYAAGLRSLGIVWSRPNAFGHGVDFRFPGTPDTGPGLTGAGKALVRRCNRMGILLDLSHLNERGFDDVAALSRAPLVASHSCIHALCPVSRNLTDRQLAAIRASGGIVGINFATAFLRGDGREDPDTPLSELVRHIRYAVDRMGEDHVGLGSDFDGTLVPREIGDVTGLKRIVSALREAGFDEGAIRKIAHGNWLRVLEETWG